MKINYLAYEGISEKLSKKNEKLKEVYDSYAECLKNLSNRGIQSGRLHDELVFYIEYVSKVPQLIENISKKISNFVSAYLLDMNEAQKFQGEYIIYDKCYMETRDYTEESFQEMISDCDNTDSDANFLEKISDWGDDLCSKGILSFGGAFNLWDARQTRFLVMEINDITKAQLVDIKETLRTEENIYSVIADEICNCINGLRECIALLNEVTKTDVENFSVQAFNEKFNNLFYGIIETLDNIYVDEGVSYKAIEKFIKTDDVENFFNKYTMMVSMFLADLSQLDMKDIDFWTMTISQMFDIALQQIMGWVRGCFGDEYSYETYLYDNEMMKLFDQMSKTKTFQESEYKTILSDYEKFMGYMKKYGDMWEKKLEGVRDKKGNLLLDKRTKNYKYFKAFFKQFKNAENILKYGTDLIEVFAAATAEYEMNLQILNSVIGSSAPDSDMFKSFSRIKKRYENCWDNVAAVAVKKIFKYGDDGVKELLKKFKTKAFKFCNVFNAIGWVEISIDVLSEITGIGEKAQAIVQLLTVGYSQLDSAEKAYKNALDTIRNCDKDSEQYTQKLNDFTVSFEYYRNILKNLFEKMSLATDGEKRDYYRYCSNKFDKLDIENFESFSVETYDEYVLRITS